MPCPPQVLVDAVGRTDVKSTRITYAEFLQVLVALSFDHANPQAAIAMAATANASSEAGLKLARDNKQNAIQQDLPGCLTTLLKEVILPLTTSS